MGMAIELAASARGRTRPNPLVGCVIARGSEILATGFHRRAGEAHGEIDALRQLEPGAARGCDLYVNLEPCCTHGRTPPCTEAILLAGIERVFVGTVDTNPRHQGAGIRALREAGVEVVVGVLEHESRRLNAPYFSTMERARPLVAAKWAMSLDGKIATASGDSAWITGEAARTHVHHLRNLYDAILVGTQTLLHDDPRLTCRLDGGRDPVRVVIDTRLQCDPGARVFDHPGTLVVHGPTTREFAPYVERGAVSLELPLLDDGRVRLDVLLQRLLEHQVMSVFAEGGGALLGSLFDANLVDRVYAFVSPRIIGGRRAVPAVAGLGKDVVADAISLTDVRVEQLGDDILIAGDIWSCSPGS